MRIAIAEDSALLREGLVRLLAAEGHEVVAAVGDAPALLGAVESRRPDVCVVDVRMPPTHTDEGLRAALELRERIPDVGVLVLSQYVEKRYASQLITGNTGGVGYLLKDRVTQVSEFLDALRRIAEGGAAFDPEVVRRLLARTSHADPLAELSAREHDVLRKMAEGAHEHGYRRRAVCLAQRGRKTRQCRIRQARSGGIHRVQPPGARDTALPRVLNRVRTRRYGSRPSC